MEQVYYDLFVKQNYKFMYYIVCRTIRVTPRNIDLWWACSNGTILKKKKCIITESQKEH